MSQKQSKRYARIIRRNRSKIIKEYVAFVKGYSLLDRLRVAWSIVLAR